MDNQSEFNLRRELKLTLIFALAEAQSAGKQLSKVANEEQTSEDYRRGIADATQAMTDALAGFILDRV